MELTLTQRESIGFVSQKGRENLIIEAGAGAGKTFVICERVKKLLENKVYAPYEIYLTTFSQSADKELKERILKIPYDLKPELVMVSTIDSLFMKILESRYGSWWEEATRKHPQFKKERKSTPTPRIIDENIAKTHLQHELVSLIEKHALSEESQAITYDFLLCGGFGNSTSHPVRQQILSLLLSEKFLSDEREKVIIASQSIHPAAQLFLNELVLLAEREFHKRLFEGELTYTDVTLFIYKMFCETKPSIVSAEGPVFFPFAPCELIVDEYQDTNEIQHAILSKLAAQRGHMVVVGDPKQSIYGFRSAHVGVFNRLKLDDTWKHVELFTNFRSHPTLLNEINELSRLTFNYREENLPEEFLSSRFHEESKNYFVEAKDLLPRDPFETDEKIRVSIVSASLEKGRSLEDIQKPALFEFQCWALANHLQEVLKRHRPSQIAILCERNKRIKKVVEALCAHGISAVYYNEKPGKPKPWLIHGCLLIKLLQGPLTSTEMYSLLISPLSFIPPEDVHLFFKNEENFYPDVSFSIFDGTQKVSQNKTSSPLIEEFFEIIKTSKEIAGINFFAAWQHLRFTLARRSATEEAFTYAVTMDPLSSRLDKFLQDAPTRIRAEQLAGSFTVTKEEEFVLPTVASHWSEEAAGASHHEDVVRVMTVHAAKGLEWEHVVFWPELGTKMKDSDFSFTQGSENHYVKWHPKDLGMNAVPFVNNEKFNAMDAVLVNGKQKWFADVERELTATFERQRIFYTAFTRAVNELTICLPPAAWNVRRSLRDKIGKLLTEDDLIKKCDIKYMPDAIFAAYCDTHFNLRKGEKKAPTPDPFGGKEIYAVSRSQGKEFKEYGPSWHDDYLNEPRCETKVISKIHMESLPEPTLDWRPVELQKVKSFFSKDFSQAVDYALLGTQYHALEEHSPRSRSPLGALKRVCVHSFHEYEVWYPESPKLPSQIAVPGRRILDFIGVTTVGKFPKEFLSSDLTAYLRPFKESENCVVIWDFKTGLPSEEHEKQMQDYQIHVEGLCKQGWLGLSAETAVVGALCYGLALREEFAQIKDTWHSNRRILWENSHGIEFVPRAN